MKNMKIETPFGTLIAEAENKKYDPHRGISIYLVSEPGCKALVGYVGGTSFEDLQIESYCNTVEGPASIVRYCDGEDIT